MSVYGYCAQRGCEASVISRTRGIPSYDTCTKGHRNLASNTLKQLHQSYVCGFMFDPQSSLVVLVLKDRPSWQAGLLNGLGGKIEAGENAHEAMSREFREESGVATVAGEWEEFATLNGPNFTVHMMRAFSDAWYRVRTMESESVHWYSASAVRAGAYPTVNNLAFLIPLATDRSGLQLPIVFQDALPDAARAA